MLPRASLHDPRPAASVRRVLRPLAWWRTQSPGWFTVGHCATAGVLQLTALCIGLVQQGRPMPPAAALSWAGLGLAVIAGVPALLTVAARTAAAAHAPRSSLLWTLVIGVAFYAALPALAFGAALWPIAPLLPVAVLWHTTFAFAPLTASEPRSLQTLR